MSDHHKQMDPSAAAIAAVKSDIEAHLRESTEARRLREVLLTAPSCPTTRIRHLWGNLRLAEQRLACFRDEFGRGTPADVMARASVWQCATQFQEFVRRILRTPACFREIAP